MDPKTIKKCIADELEDLSEQNFKKFVSALLDRREPPRVRRSQVEGKGFLEVTDVLVNAFTEPGALPVTVKLLTLIGCSQHVASLEKETAGSAAAGPPSGATGDSGEAGGRTDEHFVDKHKLELINRVSNVAPILDELLHQKVLQQESYDKIRALATSQEQIRMLYATCLRASRACKDIFYESLKKNMTYLVEDLQGNN